VELILVIILVPIAILAIDRFLFRGEFTEAVLEALHDSRGGSRKTSKVRRNNH
jgi:hypothetical protein